MQAVHYIKKWNLARHVRIIVAILIAIAGTLLVGLGTSTTTTYHWPIVETLGPTHALRTVAFLHINHTTIIWQPATSDLPLINQTLAQNTVADTIIGILPYPDVNPQRWHVAPAKNDTYHIIWLEHDNRLRSALIDANGDTQRGPITLAFRAARDFTIAALPDQSVLVVWRNPATRQVTIQIIDSQGRPDAASITTFNRAERITAAVDQAGIIHLAWFTADSPGEYTIYYHATPHDHPTLNSLTPIHTLSIAPTESIPTLQLGLDRTHVYLIWSLTTAAQPDHERVYTLVFPINQLDQTQISEIRLPQNATSYKTITADTESLNLDRVRPLATESERAAALRWAAIASNQNAVLPLAITYHTSEGWRPGVVYFQDGISLGYHQIADRPANAGPPTISFDAGERLLIAWSGLDGTTPILYTATLTDQGLASSSQNRWSLAIIAGVLAGFVGWGIARRLRNHPDSSV